MFYTNTLEENLELLKHQPLPPPQTPKWYTGLGTELLNVPMRSLDKLVAPVRPDEAYTSRSDPTTQGIAAHLVEGLTDFVPFWVGAQLAGRALSVLPTPITKLAGLALQGVSGVAMKYAPRMASAVSKVATVPNVAGAIYAYVSNKAENSYLHQSQGLDKETADELAWRGALVHTAAMLTPAAIVSKSPLLTVGSGAALNVSFGVVDRGWSSKVLEDNGHSEMAKQYRIFDMEALMTDALIGLFFGGMHSKQVRDMSLNLIKDLKDGITDRLIYKHANKSSSTGLHTSPEAHKDHMDTLARGVDDLSRGEYPSFDSDKLKNIAQNSIEDPNFKSHLPEIEPQPIKDITQDFKVKPTIEEQTTTAPFSEIETYTSERFSKLREESKEFATDVYTAINEEAQMSKLIKEKNLFQVAIDCFLRTGG